jgi:hypothetical protein
MVIVANWVMKASGPLALGDRQLPPTVVTVTSVDVGGASWSQFNWQQVVGVGVAGLARISKAPMLLAVLCGIATTALLRLFGI